MLGALLVGAIKTDARAGALSDSADATICYFSLNNEKEFHEARIFFDKINANTGRRFTVQEFYNPNEILNPEESFKKLVASGQKCDGLVISGHHSNAFGGRRTNAKGTLSLDFLESLSCEPEYSDWFQDVKALWLQGCRTLGTNVSEDDDSALARQEIDPNFHSQRVGAVRAEDYLPQNYAQLNYEFSNTLDQDNPLSSRYLRMFQQATLFGWSGSAPDEKAKSELSLLFHFAHMAALQNQRPASFEGLLGGLSARQAFEFSEAADSVFRLHRREQDENNAIQAWMAHAAVSSKNITRIPGYDRPKNVNAFPYANSMRRPELLVAGQKGCVLRKNLSPQQTRQTMDEILGDKKLLPLNFNDILKLHSKMRKTNNEQWQDLKGQLIQSANMKSFLEKKLNRKYLGIMRRMDYYTFYRDLYASRLRFIEDYIKNEILYVLKTKVPEGENPEEVRKYKRDVISSAVRNKILDDDILAEILMVGLNDRDPIVIREVPYYAGQIGSSGMLVLEKILSHPDKWVRMGALASLPNLGAEKAIPFLKNALQDPDDYVRQFALTTSARLGREGLPVIFKAQGGGDSSLERMASCLKIKIEKAKKDLTPYEIAQCG